MPELPDVEALRLYLNESSLDQKIRELRIHQSRVLDAAPQTFRKKLSGASFKETKRHGKYLFAELDNGHVLYMHFGMTGDLAFYQGEEEPEYSVFQIKFESGYALSYLSKRKFGKIGLADDLGEFIDRQGLGPDALEITRKEFTELLSAKSGMIKPALMDQGVLAGLGNIYVDEILYQEDIHPEEKLEYLDRKDLEGLFNTMQRVLKTAIRHDAVPEELPDHYLIRHRSDGGACPRHGGKISRIKVGGRSTFFCPQGQKKRDT